MGSSENRVRAIIRYDGQAVDNHEMDVKHVATALWSLAEIIQIANKRANGDEAKIKVLIRPDVEQQCFMLEISIVQSFLEQARAIIGHEDVSTAKEIAEWIGIIVGAGGASLFGLFKFIHLLKQKGQKPETEVTGDGHIIIRGDGNSITVSEQVYAMAQDPKVVENSRKLLSPLREKGYDRLSFADGEKETIAFDKEEADGLTELLEEGGLVDSTESTSDIRGNIRIKSPQYEGKAKWTVLWNGRTIQATMEGNARAWVEDFQNNKVNAPPNTILDVSMTETILCDENGEAIGQASYRIYEIHNVSAPPMRDTLATRNPDKDS